MPIQKQVLPAGVDLWSDEIDRDAGRQGSLDELSAEEQARAGRFRFDRDRERFVARRLFLRAVLCEYIGASPAEVRFRTTALGRPELDPDRGVSFSTSHSDGLAVVAVAHDRSVGVDVERIRPIADAMEVAEQFLSRPEVEMLRSAPESSRSRQFLTIWTRKESYAKAIGAGLTLPFDAFDVSTRDGVHSGTPGGAQGDSRFEFLSLDTFAGYAMAVTVSEGSAAAGRP
jgi:4'-phosphopantetheinyl transferase